MCKLRPILLILVLIRSLLLYCPLRLRLMLISSFLGCTTTRL